VTSLALRPLSTSTSDPKRWLAFAVILSATLLGVLDFLIVNLALPSIKKTIGATDAQVQLTVAVYGLAFRGLSITGGRLGDIYGRKRIFQIGMAGFTFASALCGFAQTPAATHLGSRGAGRVCGADVAAGSGHDSGHFSRCRARQSHRLRRRDGGVSEVFWATCWVAGW
jgi:MFS family permease